MRGGFSGKRNKIRVTGFDYGLLVTVHTFTMSFGLLPCTIKARGFEHVLLRGGLVKNVSFRPVLAADWRRARNSHVSSKRRA